VPELSGHEQKGRRPALVISNDLFNKAGAEWET
jgi:mRNA-degrading endonuclease toxin of MazEF toxin-antitoxin module